MKNFLVVILFLTFCTSVYSAQIFIQQISRNPLVLDVELSETVLEVKQKIQEKEGYPVEIQKLFFGMKILENNTTLAEYGIEDNDTFYLKLG